MSALVISPYVPAPTSGAGLRTLGVVRALARTGPVEVVYAPFGTGEPPPIDGVTYRAINPSRGPARAMAFARARAQGIPADFARAVSPELIRAAADSTARVIAVGPEGAAALLGLARRRPVVYLAHNVESSFRGGPALARFERKALAAFAETWMPTRADERTAADLTGGAARTRYVPSVLDVGRIPPVTPAGRQRVLFLGDFTYQPNRDALGFLEQAMRHVWAELPEARLVLAGRGLPEGWADRDPRIEALGFVDDLDAVYASCDAAAVPLLTGGGSPLKFAEALARGLPVVATDHAARLLEDGIPGEHFLAAAGPEAFAAALVRALQGGAAEVAAAGRALALRAYSVETLVHLLAA